jgi:hypothetical protein
LPGINALTNKKEDDMAEIVKKRFVNVIIVETKPKW